MRTAVSIIAAVLLASAGSARAERRDCEVVFVRAPDEVRLVIESWLAQEPRCSGSIELRVVETESGSFYLIAQRPDGRIHEREVPDAQSAGVLVASWVADDWTSTPPDDDDVDVTPEVAAPGVTKAVVVPVVKKPALTAGKWLSLNGMLMVDGEGGGLRADLDVFGGGASKWTLGIGAEIVSSRFAGYVHDSSYLAYGPNAWIDVNDTSVMITLARAFRFSDRWAVRASSGLGVAVSDVDLLIDNSYDLMQETLTGTSIVYELGLQVQREMFDNKWAISVGPKALWIRQDLRMNNGSDLTRDQLQVMFTAGARYRL